MLLFVVAAAAAPDRSLLFASMGGPNGCTGHGPDNSKCDSRPNTQTAGESPNGDWVCNPTPEENAPDCRWCSNVAAPENAAFPEYSWHGCGTRVVPSPPVCCYAGGPFALDELQLAVTKYLGATFGLPFPDSGLDSSYNGLAYGVKYTQLSGPFNGEPSCLVSRHVLSDEIFFPYSAPLVGNQAFTGLNETIQWVSFGDNGPWISCDWRSDNDEGLDDCFNKSSLKFLGYERAKYFDELAGAVENSAMVRDCTADSPLEYQTITEATYLMGTNPETSCTLFGATTIQSEAGEQNDECLAPSMQAKIKAGNATEFKMDAEAFLAVFHGNN